MSGGGPTQGGGGPPTDEEIDQWLTRDTPLQGSSAEFSQRLAREVKRLRRELAKANAPIWDERNSRGG